MMSEVTEWLALHRVHEGSVMIQNSDYVNAGRPVVEFLVPTFDELISSGLLTLGQPDPLGWRVCVTHTGQAKYAELRPIAIRTGMLPDEHGKHRHPGCDDGEATS
ncbi:MAG: hypothetical protein ACT4NY_21105 [Pseudonocardiales bacterium]